jgi:hypothetical protein
MRLFGCRTCEEIRKAKDQEILHLLAELTQVHKHLESTNARLCEIASPGSNLRAVPPPRPTKPAQVIPKKESTHSTLDGANFPGYERPEPADRFEVS